MHSPRDAILEYIPELAAIVVPMDADMASQPRP